MQEKRRKIIFFFIFSFFHFLISEKRCTFAPLFLKAQSENVTCDGELGKYY